MSGIELVAANGAEIATRVDGEAGRPWIVLSNSLGCTHESWSRQMPMLTRRYRTLRYDTRGHGRSSAPPGPYSLDVLVADLVALMDHFGIDKADVLGLSMGGMTALGLAIDHPDRVARLVCCAARSDAIPPFVESWNQRMAAVREAGGMTGVLAFTLERWFTADFRAAHPEVVQEAADMILATDPEGYIACAQALQKLDYKRRLGEIRAPALFLAGADDMAAPAAALREMASLTPGAEYVEIAGAHVSAMENPDGFNEAVGGWLAR